MTTADDHADLPCRGKADLFDSIARSDHEAAKALCMTCPALTDCLILTAIERDRVSKVYRPGITGTWAGQLFGAREAPTDDEVTCARRRRELVAAWDEHHEIEEGIA